MRMRTQRCIQAGQPVAFRREQVQGGEHEQLTGRPRDLAIAVDITQLQATVAVTQQ